MENSVGFEAFIISLVLVTDQDIQWSLTPRWSTTCLQLLRSSDGTSKTSCPILKYVLLLILEATSLT